MVIFELMVVVVVVIVLVLVIVVAVVTCWWYGCHVTMGDMAPAFSVKGRKGDGECNDSPAYGQMVMMASIVTIWMMASIVTVWMMWHIAMSLPAHSIAFCCGWHLLLLLWVASDGSGW